MALTKVKGHIIADDLALGGNPTTSTQSASDNSTKIATTAYVTTAVSNLVDGAPSTLNTLNEIAAALNDDAALNTTLTNSIATKAPLANPDFTGQLQVSNAANTIQEFTVTGNSTRSTLRLNSKDSSGNSVDLRMHSLGDGPRAELFTYSNHDLEFATNNGAPQMILKTDGKFGIGTDNPRYLLETRADIDSFVMKIENDGNSAGTNGNSYADASDGLWVDTRWNTATNTPFKVTSNSGTAPMMIIKGNGNVGIGTSSPGVELDILRHSNAYPLRIGSSQGEGRAIVFADMHASPSKYNWVAGAQFGTNNAFEITPSTAVGGYTFTAGTGTTFLQDGKVGIGTNAPGGAAGSLSVWGRGTSSPSATNAATSYSNAMFRINHFANSSVGLSIGSAGANVTYIQSSYNEGTTSPLLINPYANDAATSFIGMANVTSPAATVHIRPTGNSWEHSLLLQHSASNTGWNIHPETQDNSLWFGYNANTGSGIANQTANEYLVIDSSGGVGIGNNRPTVNAHAAANNLVIGNTSTADNGMTILGNANHTGRIFFGDPDLNRSGQIEYVHNGDMLQFYTGNALSTKMTEGRLGVNVTPSEALHTYVASGSNEYRNQLGSQSVYMRHGVTRNTPQGTSVFDILALSNQDIVVGTSGMFLVGDGGMHNSEGTNRLRVDGHGVTIGEVLPTLTTTQESLQRRLWVRGQGVFHSQDQGTLLPRARTSALNIGPSASRGTTGNPGTAAYNATTPTGHVSGGIAWDHLMNYSTYGNMGYNSKPHAWLGMELHSTPGHELSNMIMCTREGSASTSEPLVGQRWYATGEITTPRNPAFTAYGTGLANQGTEGNHGTWNETIDRGGNFTAGTNAYFTAPVDGLYAFWAQCNFNTGSSTPYYWRAYKNTGGVGIFYGSGANQSWDHIMAYIMIAMDKNDTFEWRYKGDPDEGAEWAQCGGYLVG